MKEEKLKNSDVNNGSKMKKIDDKESFKSSKKEKKHPKKEDKLNNLHTNRDVKKTESEERMSKRNMKKEKS